MLSKWEVNLGEEYLRKSPEQVLTEHAELFRKLPSVALGLDQDDVEGVLLEKAAKFCAGGELARAGKLIRGYIEEREDHNRSKLEVSTWKDQQKKKARLRRPTPLTELIASKVALKPDISTSQLLDRLTAEEGNGTIENIENGVIAWRDKNDQLKKNKVSGLKDMLHREKERQSKPSRTKPSEQS